MDQDKILKRAWEIADRTKKRYVGSEEMIMAQNELLAEMSGERNLQKESNNLKIFTGQIISYQEFNQDIANEESQLQDELSRTL